MQIRNENSVLRKINNKYSFFVALVPQSFVVVVAEYSSNIYRNTYF